MILHSRRGINGLRDVYVAWREVAKEERVSYKTILRRRHHHHDNPIGLACLALTDLMVGLVIHGAGGGGVNCLVVFPTHFNPNNFLLILLQISLLFRCTSRLK